MEENNSSNVLGIQATISSADIEKGANDFIRKINEMEKASDSAVSAMSGQFQELNNEILSVASSIEKSRIELEKVLNATQSKSNAPIQSGAQNTSESKNLNEVVSSTQRAVSSQKELNKTLKQQEKQYEENAKKLSEYEDKLLSLQDAQERGVQRAMSGNATIPIADEIRRVTEEYEKLREIQSRLQSEIDSTNEALSESGEANEQLEEQGSLLVRMLGGAENYKEIMSALPAPIREAGDNISKMTGAAKKFIATPLGAILGALILAFQAIKTYLTSTAEGQERLAKVTGFLSGILKPFKNVVISIGKALVDAFINPKEAIINFGKLLMSQVVNRIVALVDIVDGLARVIASGFSLDVKGMKSAISDVGAGFMKLATGVENAEKKIADFGKKVIDSGKENTLIAAETKSLDLQVKEWEKKKQQLEAKKQQARGIVSNTSLPVKERMEAEKEYEKILDEEYQKELYFINKKIDLQNKAMKLAPSGGSLEDKEALSELEAEREKIKADYQRGIAERQDTNGTLINAQREALIEIGNMEAELTLKNQNRTLSLMKDGHKKRLQELTAEKDSELNALDELQEKFVKQNRRAGVEVAEDGLTDSQRQLLANSRTMVNNVYNQNVKKSLEEELADILTYQQARQKVEEKFAEKRKDLYEADGKTLKAGVSEGNIVELDNDKKDAINAIDEEFASKSQVYLGWVDSISDMTIKQLNKTLDDANANLSQLEGQENADPKKLAIARAKIVELQKKIEQLEGQGDDSNKRSIDTWKELGEMLGDTADEFEALGDAIGGTTGEIVSSLGSTFSSTVGLMSNITQFVEICQKGIKNTAGTAVSAVKAVEAASVILAIISTTIQVIQKVVDVAKNLHNKQYEKDIEDKQERINKLKESYSELEKVAEKTYASNKVSQLRDMNDKLEEQNRLLQEQKDAEESKKGEVDTTKYDDAMEANRKKIEENKEAIEEAIFGNDIQSAIESFADAYGQAIAEGKDLNESMKDHAVKMMKQMVQEEIKAYIAGQGKLEALREKMALYFEDGIFSDSEIKAIKVEAEAIGKDLENKFAWAEDLLTEEESLSSSSASRRGIATASQESVDENNGRLMSIQLSISEIITLQKMSQADTSAIRHEMIVQNRYVSEIVDMQYETIGYLKSIDTNTKQLYQMNERLGKIEENTRQAKR